MSSKERSFVEPLGESGHLPQLWAAAGASGLILLMFRKSSVSPGMATAYDIDDFRELLGQLHEVLDECESMRHLSRHPTLEGETP